ncbi:MAG: hypothetical protein AABY07_10200 [Nanoarchaeota archaeon]
MNTEQKNRIANVIQNNCSARRKYISRKGGQEQHCIIMGLIVDSNIEFDPYYKSINDVQILHSSMNDIKLLLMQEYGLDKIDLAMLQYTNDEYENIKLRRIALLEFLNSINDI